MVVCLIMNMSTYTVDQLMVNIVEIRRFTGMFTCLAFSFYPGSKYGLAGVVDIWWQTQQISNLSIMASTKPKVDMSSLPATQLYTINPASVASYVGPSDTKVDGKSLTVPALNTAFKTDVKPLGNATLTLSKDGKVKSRKYRFKCVSYP